MPRFHWLFVVLNDLGSFDDVDRSDGAAAAEFLQQGGFGRGFLSLRQNQRFMFDFLAFLTLLVVVGKQQSEQEGDDHEAQAHKYWYSNVVVLALLRECVGE